jgi:hypothetical protein
MVKEISIAKLKKELLLAKETIAALSQEKNMIEERLIMKEEVRYLPCTLPRLNIQVLTPVRNWAREREMLST